jgi:hypothetical protein
LIFSLRTEDSSGFASAGFESRYNHSQFTSPRSPHLGIPPENISDLPFKPPNDNGTSSSRVANRDPPKPTDILDNDLEISAHPIRQPKIHQLAFLKMCDADEREQQLPITS